MSEDFSTNVHLSITADTQQIDRATQSVTELGEAISHVPSLSQDLAGDIASPFGVKG